MRDRQSQRLGGLEVNHELELRRLFDREAGGLGALENLVDGVCGARRLLTARSAICSLCVKNIELAPYSGPPAPFWVIAAKALSSARASHLHKQDRHPRRSGGILNLPRLVATAWFADI